ncbi:unnamed protein product [Urochloa decumbens]|uniref:BTB domain-containing protein n=1 Tax=Urochloa decumbens TaxID=240449 RepID=A0ABC8Y4A4_9POAL
MSSAAKPEPWRSATSVVPVQGAWYHVLKIDGHSRTLGTGLRCHESYCPFRAGEHTWSIAYYPMGIDPASADFIAIFLVLVDTAADGEQCKMIRSLQCARPGSEAGSILQCYHRNPKFMERGELEKSGLVKDDCFALRVDVHLYRESTADVLRPTFDMHLHLSDLLLSNKGTDVEFLVGGETFAAHRLVLRARSPVFKAQLLPPMMKGASSATNDDIVEIDDIEPRVFKALLAFIYTDVWPKMEHDDDDDEFAMAQGLLVAAGRYGLQRLKLLCENWLCNHIDTTSVSTILALSEKQRCANLKEACFDFISSSTFRFEINKTEGFEHLAQSCPHIAKELIVDAVNHDKEKAKHSIPWNQRNNEVSVIKMDHTDRSEPSTAMAYSEPSRSGTTIVAVRNHHVLKIDGYSRALKAHGARPRFRSRPFRAGGRTWHFSYSPLGNPHRPDNTDSIALFLVLDEPVTAQATFSLLDQDGAPVPEYTFTTRMNNFSDRGFGYEIEVHQEGRPRTIRVPQERLFQVYMVKEAPSIAAARPAPLHRTPIGSLRRSRTS